MINKTKRPIFLRILAAAAALFLAFIIISATTSFVGNPITSLIAKGKISTYIEQNYSFLQLEQGKVSYNFKDGSYNMKVKDVWQPDIHFYINYSPRRKVVDDDYAFRVLNGSNVLDRFSDEYEAIVKPYLETNGDFDIKHISINFGKDLYEKFNSGTMTAPKPGTPFDINLPYEPTISLTINLDDTSFSALAKVLENTHRLVRQKGYNFYEYTLYNGNEDLVTISNVTPKNIESGNLTSLLEKAVNSDDGGIYVFIKSKDGK